VLFKADYSDSFSTDIFHGNPSLNIIEACDDTSGWSGKSFSDGNRDISVTVIDCSSAAEIIPNIPQQSLSRIVRTDGKATGLYHFYRRVIR